MDVDYCNGLTFNEVLIPEEIIIHILSYVDVQQLLKCRLVCKQWNESITSMSLWFEIYRRKYRDNPKALPWQLYYHLFKSEFFNTNLLKNVNGEQKFAHWSIIENGGDRFKIEKIPIGSDPLPKNVAEFNSHTSCFATSYSLCTKTQRIKFKDSELHILSKHKPHIYVSEWVAPRFDCGCKYISKLTIVCKNGERIVGGTLDHHAEQFVEPNWTKLETLITDYPNNIQHLEFTHGGCDTQFWAGHYGIKMAGAVVKILFESIRAGVDN